MRWWNVVVCFGLTLPCWCWGDESKDIPHLSYDEINSEFVRLAQDFPQFIRVTSAQEEFSLPSPGMCGANTPCITQIIHVTNFLTFHNDDEFETRPEVYISGELHGDERVGPHTALEFVRVLVEGYDDNPWLKHLVNTRSIILTPLTNSIGYFSNAREENRIDPNRDYPIDQKPTLCMQTICSRIVNELFRQHLFQVAITFHGGMEAIAMEWGTMSRNHRGISSPDDDALLEIGNGLARFAGPVSLQEPRLYPVGRMNDLVYPVPGGMEDWGYAGSWDPLSRREPCTPQTFGGYALEKTIYSDSMLRTVNVLVETSDAKWPSTLGQRTSRADLLNPQSGTGHVPRNVRLSLMLTDLAQPYVVITRASVFPTSNGGGMSLVLVQWEVGGSFLVNETNAQLFIQGDEVYSTSVLQMNRHTRWKSGQNPNRESHPLYPEFSACFLVPAAGGEWTVQARARVDSPWKSDGLQQTRVNPQGFPPQSHLVNARTNPEWSKSNAQGKKIQGKLDWFSLRVGVVEEKEQDGILEECTTQTSSFLDQPIREEINSTGTVSEEHPAPPSPPPSHLSNNAGMKTILVVVVVLFVLVVSVGCYLQRRRKLLSVELEQTQGDEEEASDLL